MGLTCMIRLATCGKAAVDAQDDSTSDAITVTAMEVGVNAGVALKQCPPAFHANLPNLYQSFCQPEGW